MEYLQAVAKVRLYLSKAAELLFDLHEGTGESDYSAVEGKFCAQGKVTMGGGWAVSAPLLCQNLFWCVGFSFSFSLSLEVSVVIRPLARVLTVLCSYSSGKAGAVTSQLWFGRRFTLSSRCQQGNLI